jgi:hypothetical protein
MVVIHDMPLQPRLAVRAVERALRGLPAVVLTGARQTGKTTLVRELLHGLERQYLTLDDRDVLEQATRAPADLAARGPRLTLDDAQRHPGLLQSVQAAADGRRSPGRFILAGSANLLGGQGDGDTLRGCAGLTMWPMARSERRGLGRAGLWPELFEAREEDWPDVLSAAALRQEDWRAAARAGGYCTSARDLDRPEARTAWFTEYAREYLEHELPHLSAISSPPAFERLMKATCRRVGQLVNQTALGRDAALPQPTVYRWLNLLERSYQLVRLPAFPAPRAKRLIKTPKIYWSDSGLALHLAGLDEPGAGHLENLVLHDLLVWRDAEANRPDISYWRPTSGGEVKLVVDWRRQVLPVDVRTTTRPRAHDARQLQAFRAEQGDRARAGLLLHAGDGVEWLAPGVLAAPWWKVT